MTEKPCDSATEELTWNLFVDAASSDQGAGAGIVLLGPHKIAIEYAVHLSFKATNNVAEYEALLTGLEIAIEVKAEKLKIHSDSQLVTSQVLGQFQTKDQNMAKYMAKAKEQLKKIEKNGGQWEIIPIPREENTRADAIAKAAAVKSQLYVSLQMKEDRMTPTVEEQQLLPVAVLDPWMQPIVAYLADGVLPEGRTEVAKLVRISSVYSLIDGALYRTSVTHPWSKCISLEEGSYVLREIHEGECGAHEGVVTLYRKSMLQGFYWPTMKRDAEEMVKKCDKCQRFGSLIRTSAAHQSTIGSPWPFMIWGVDILGPFVPARGQVKFIVVTVDHFTKWIEVQPMSTITSRKIQKWLSNEVMSRKATGETPFRLTYGSEAVLPVELGMPTLRVQVLDKNRNEESLRLCLDLLEERRQQVAVRPKRIAGKWPGITTPESKKRKFEEGDLVLKKSEIGRGAAGVGKLEANWDGPYRVAAVVGKGAYIIAHLDGTPLPRTWNVENLKLYLQ
ncbi:uncharacterized protein LOC126672608 [Mercurialis annua]|uniref:uncharacterized protein LOC126672608 n=1 Tax=Mercurialis annua TaxID=3986 RepID=UPI00215ED204|nr:uncharacterized protein LOC126672608 [Mercurialis annua]